MVVALGGEPVGGHHGIGHGGRRLKRRAIQHIADRKDQRLLSAIGIGAIGTRGGRLVDAKGDLLQV